MIEQETTTDREFEAIELIALLGFTKKQIAERWNRSIRTVETTIKNGYRKIGAKSSADATRWYFGYTFKMAHKIKEKQKEILQVLILVLSLHSMLPTAPDLQARRVRRTQRTAQVQRIGRLRTRKRERAVPDINYWSIHNQTA